VIILGKLADVKEVSHLIDAKDVKLQSGKIWQQLAALEKFARRELIITWWCSWLYSLYIPSAWRKNWFMLLLIMWRVCFFW
jgi:hypothetical protein